MRVVWLTDIADNAAPGRTVLVGPDRIAYQIQSSVFGQRGRLKLAGVNSRQAAEELRDQVILIPFAEAAPLPVGRYYPPQIVGVEVVTTDGERLGAIVEIVETGSNDVYVVQTPGGELLLPAIADVVKSFDVDAQRMVVELIPGLR